MILERTTYVQKKEKIMLRVMGVQFPVGPGTFRKGNTGNMVIGSGNSQFRTVGVLIAKLRSRFSPSGDVTAKIRPNDNSAEWPDTVRILP